MKRLCHALGFGLFGMVACALGFRLSDVLFGGHSNYDALVHVLIWATVGYYAGSPVEERVS